MADLLAPLAPLMLPFATAMTLSLALVPACRRLGRRCGFVASPAGDRWHARPVPLLGGAGIFAAVAIGLFLLQRMPPRPVLFGGAAALFLLGLIDDRRPLNATTKLVVQFVVAALFVFFGEGLEWTGSATADAVLTVLWVVGVANAFNLIDNMDGLCAGVTLICGASWLAILLAAEPSGAAFADAWYLALLLGAVAGFLVYNRHPASIFMGDAGTLFLGTNIAGLTLRTGGGEPGAAPALAVVAPLLVLTVPLLDMALVTCTRLLGARSVVSGGRDHTSHRLVAIGLSEPRAVAVLWAIAALSGGAGWTLTALDGSWSILMSSTAVIGALIFGAYLAHVDVADAFGEKDRRGSRRRMLSFPESGAYAGIGRSAEVLLDFCLITVAYYATYRLRFEGPAFDDNFGRFLSSLPIVMACQLAALRVFGAYGATWWRFGLMEAVALARAVAGGTVAALLVILYLYRFTWYSRTVFVIDGVLLLTALVATRVSFRLIGEFVDRNRNDGESLVFYGAGEGDQAALREFLRTSRARYDVLGFVDDEPRRRWRRALGYVILGDRGRLLDLVRAGKVDVVIVGANQAAQGALDDLRRVCDAHDVRLLAVGLAVADLRPASGGDAARERFLAGG